ncbi:hypothetical protein D3C71_2013440 [compost metagenome]
MGVDDEDIAVFINELALTAKGREGFVTIVVVIGQGFFQQGDGGLAVVLIRSGRLRLGEAQHKHEAQHSEPLHKPHCASLVLVDVSRA